MCIWFIVEKPLTPQKFVFGDSSKPAANEISSPARLGRCERWVLGSGFYPFWSTSHLESGCQSQKWRFTSGFWDAQSTKLFHLGADLDSTGGFLASLTPSALEVPLGKTSTIPAMATVMEAYQKISRKKRWSFSLKNSQVFNQFDASKYSFQKKKKTCLNLDSPKTLPLLRLALQLPFEDPEAPKIQWVPKKSHSAGPTNNNEDIQKPEKL